MSKEVKVFALSTCGWCKKTIAWLDENNINYDKVYVDLTSGDERKDLIAEVKKHNPKSTFPTVVINGGENVVVGYKIDELKDLLM